MREKVSGSDWDRFKKEAPDPLIAFLLAVLFLSGLLLYPPAWVVLWSVLASFLFFDLLMSKLAKGKGMFLNPLTKKIMPKGHAFLTLFLLIVGVTIATAAGSDLIAQNLRANLPVALLANVFVCLWLAYLLDKNYY